MLRALHAEYRKAFSLRSTYVYVICIAGAIAGPTYLAYFFGESLAGAEWDLLLSTISIAILVAILFGSSSIGGDMSHRLIAHGFLTLQHRWHLPAAKAIMIATLSLLGSVVGYVGAGILELSLGNSWPMSPHTIELVVLLLAPSIFALMALGITAVCRSQIAAVGICLAFMLIIENALAFGPLEWGPKVAKYLPFMNFSYIVYGSDMPFSTNTHTALTVIAVWTVALFGAGVWALQRRDVK